MYKYNDINNKTIKVGDTVVIGNNAVSGETKLRTAIVTELTVKQWGKHKPRVVPYIKVKYTNGTSGGTTNYRYNTLVIKSQPFIIRLYIQLLNKLLTINKLFKIK
jgi:hypothetical protein